MRRVEKDKPVKMGGVGHSPLPLAKAGEEGE